ncbi:unnamed protein product, partial [Didymodactylos carnosus]
MGRQKHNLYEALISFYETLTDEDIQEIIKSSGNPRITHRIYTSIAPSIYGYEIIKKSIAIAVKEKILVFQGYLTYKKDNNEFLLFLLKQLVQEFIVYQHDHLNAPNKICKENLISRARQYGVVDLQQFYQSTLFRFHGFKYEDKLI